MQFVCRVGTAEGRVSERLEEAPDELTLRGNLEQNGLHIFSIRQRGILSGLRGGSKRKRRSRIQIRALLIFNQEFAALLKSGLPVLQALEMMFERQSDPVFRQVLEKVCDRVRGGQELSVAFGEFGDLFPPLFAPTLKAGERSGELELVLRRFVRYQKLVLDARKKVVSALIYPAVLIGLSLALIVVMTAVVMPKFTDFFDGLNAELPLLTRITMGVSLFVRDWILWIAIGLVLGYFSVREWLDSDVGKATLDRWKLKVPLLGQVFQKMALSEFSRSLATLQAGGIPLVPALEVSVQAVGNTWIRQNMVPVTQAVREGRALAVAVEDSGVASSIAVDMIRVGEATGALEGMLTDLADFLDEEVETTMERLLALLEPIMLILMGVIVATLLIAVYLPLYSLMGQVKA